MKTVIHVNQHVIKANAVHGADDPPLTVKTYKDNRRAFTAEIKDAAGNVVARVINRPHDPLSCGARVWIETYHDVEVVTERALQGEVSDEVEAPKRDDIGTTARHTRERRIQGGFAVAARRG